MQHPFDVGYYYPHFAHDKLEPPQAGSLEHMVNRVTKANLSCTDPSLRMPAPALISHMYSTNLKKKSEFFFLENAISLPHQNGGEPACCKHQASTYCFSVSEDSPRACRSMQRKDEITPCLASPATRRKAQQQKQ